MLRLDLRNVRCVKGEQRLKDSLCLASVSSIVRQRNIGALIIRIGFWGP